MYLGESTIQKGEYGVLVCVESFQSLFDGMTRGLSKFCEIVSLINLSSTSGLNPLDFLFLFPPFVHMKENSKLNVEYLEIYTTLLKNTANLINPA